MNDQEKISATVRAVGKSPSCLVRDGTIELQKRKYHIFLTKIVERGTLLEPSG